MPVQTIVVAEDDGAIRDLVTHHLEREGFVVVGAADGQAALRRARGVADLVVLDVGLPGIDGFDVARTLRRERRAVPIVMVTARTDEIDRVVGFELGADDYVCKPFSPRELVARVKAVLRRNGQPSVTERPTLSFGRLEIDERAREARVDGNDVRLKPREFALLIELASNPGIALSRERLLQKVWGFDFNGDERTVDVHVHRLRLKIETAGKLPGILRTVHGFGYKFQRP
ncbi:MAG: response regulator transcription factor [Candidatus Eremiobacteraeota bacterium]|nr:response regulator transcription factor [Candidatus Eremiobacteraeota bacterium]MBV8372213.1 response regulator transcription factor [Candidatus Eremiobacteraeota bacterium]